MLELVLEEQPIPQVEILSSDILHLPVVEVELDMQDL